MFPSLQTIAANARATGAGPSQAPQNPLSGGGFMGLGTSLGNIGDAASWLGGQTGISDAISAIPGLKNYLTPGVQFPGTQGQTAGGSLTSPSGIPSNPSPNLSGFMGLIKGIAQAYGTTYPGAASGVPTQDMSAFNKAMKGKRYVDPQTGLPTSGQTPAQKDLAAVLNKKLDYSLVNLGSVGAVTVPVPGVQDNTKELNSLSQSIGVLQSRGLLDYLPGAAKLEGVIQAPAMQALENQGLASANTINTYGRGAVGMLQQVPGQIANDYNQAMQLQQGLSRGVQQAMASGNPTQAEGSLGIDAGQKPGLAAQNFESFNQAGNVLGGVGQLGIGSLAAEAANQMAYARTLPALVDESTTQSLAAQAGMTGTALANLASSGNAAAVKLAQGEMTGDQRVASQQISLYHTLLSSQTASQKLSAEVAGQNANRIQSANAKNASLYAQGIQLGISRGNLQLSQKRAAISMIKTMFPSASNSTSNTAAGAVDTYFKTAAGSGKPTYVTQPGIPSKDNPTGKSIRVATYPEQGTYRDAVQKWYTNHQGTWSPQQTQIIANNYFNYGYGRDPNNLGDRTAYRGFDSRQASFVSKAANGDTDIGWDPSLNGGLGGAFITLAQATGLAQGGYQKLVGSFQKKTSPTLGTIFLIPRYR